MESKLEDATLKNNSNDAPVEQDEKVEAHQVDTHPDLSEKIKELTQRNARNREIANQKQERNIKLLEQLERSLAESNQAKSFFSEHVIEETATPQIDIVDITPETSVEEPVEVERVIEEITEPQTETEEVASETEILEEKSAETVIETSKEKPKSKTGFKVMINLLFYMIVIFVVGSVIISAMEHFMSEPFEISGYTLQRTNSENRVQDFAENTLIIISNNAGLEEVVFSSYGWGQILAFFENSLTFKILVSATLLIGLSAGKEYLIDQSSKRLKPTT